jgi:hypothetical protein
VWRVGEASSQKSGDCAEASTGAEKLAALRVDRDPESEAFREVNTELVNSLLLRDYEVRSR